MSITVATRQSSPPSFNSNQVLSEYQQTELPTLQTNSQTSRSSQIYSPESQPVNLRGPIPEEEDETSSEPVTEPVTPTDIHHPYLSTLQDKMNGTMLQAQQHNLPSVSSRPPLLRNIARQLPPSAEKKPSFEAKNAIQKRPPLPSPNSTKESGIKKVMSGLFRRQSTQNSTPTWPFTQLDNASISGMNGSDPTLGRDQLDLATEIFALNSTCITKSTTSTSPGPSIRNEAKQPPLHTQESSGDELFPTQRKKIRSSTSIDIRDKISSRKIAFAQSEKESKHGRRWHRATSVDRDNSPDSGSAQLPYRQVWALAADAGTGLKSRRLSLSLPDDFTVDVVELYKEFSDQSKLVGRRGKSVGKGATANVRLMYQKGNGQVVYAVKEFRGKSTKEKPEDYEQKVKSEYSIAKSVHHPNVVKTFRLSTHNGRWNHVMEYCEMGDLFSLVSKKYLSHEDHLVDRLCLFKQLIQGLHYLHTNGIAHRDVKLENLLITKDSKLKITDFGVSEVFAGIHPGLRAAGGQCGKEMGEIRMCSPGMCGSPPYVAPEVIAKNVPYDPRPSDVWGAAIVMLCMCANGFLWDEAKAGSSMLYDDLVRGWTKWNAKHENDTVGITETDYPYVGFFDQHINPPALRRVLLTMLNPDPSKRVSMAAVARNRWVKHVECCQIDSYDDPTQIIDASRSGMCRKNLNKVVCHNHLPKEKRSAHRLLHVPGSTNM